MRRRLRIHVASAGTTAIVLLYLTCLSLLAHAETAPDELRLMDGTVLRGTFISGNVQTIVFRTDNGVVTFDIGKVAALLMNAAAVGPSVTGPATGAPGTGTPTTGTPGTGTPGTGTPTTGTPGTGTPGTGTPTTGIPGTGTPGTGTPTTSEPPKTPASTSVEQRVPTDAPATIDAGVRRIEQAFRAGDVQKVLEFTVPSQREQYGKIFQAHRNELVKIADLLATRKLVTTTGSTVEYEVTDRGRTFPVFFLRIDGVWMLSDL